MSNRKSGNKTNKTDRGASSNNGAAAFSRLDYLAVVPGVLMCLITLIMLLTDAAMPEMAQAQYRSYPALFRGADIVIAAAGIIYYFSCIINNRKNFKSADDHGTLGKSADDHDTLGKSVGDHDTLGKADSDHSVPGLASGGAQKASCLFFCLFIVCIILSTAVNGLDDKAIHGVSFRDIGIFNLISFVMIYMGLSSRIGAPALRQPKNAESSRHGKSSAAMSLQLRKFVLLFYITAADLTALAAAYDQWISPIPAFREKKDISTIFFNGNHYGYFLVMAILLSAGLFLYSHDPKTNATASDSHGPKAKATALCPHISKTRIFAACSMALNGFILALNGSAGCILAVSAGLLLTLAVTLTTRRDALKLNLILLAVLAAALALIAVRTSMLQTLASDITSIISGREDADSAGHNRWLLWTSTCDYIASKPLLGYGCEGLSDILMETTGRADPHNEILSYAAQFGIPAAAFYTAGVISAFISLFTDIHQHNMGSSNDPGRICGKSSGSGTSLRSAGGSNAESMDETRAACFLAAAGYFISSLFGVTMFYTLPFFFIFLGMSLKCYQNNLYLRIIYT